MPRAVVVTVSILGIAALAATVGAAFTKFSRGSDQDVNQRADQSLNTGLEYEADADWDQALASYDRILKQFPNHPLGTYRRAVCLQKLGKSDEAAAAYRAVVTSKGAAKELIDDARTRLEAVVFPSLSPSQQEQLDTAIDYLQTAEDLQSDKAPPADKNLYQTPLERAVDLLDSLRADSPNYIPAYFRLGVAYEHLGQHLNAYDAYDRYLDGYQRFKLPLGEAQRGFRRRKVVCEAILHLGKDQVFVRSYDNHSLYVGHAPPDAAKKELAVLAAAKSPEEQARVRLRMQPGLVDRTGTSLQSGVNAAFYLRPLAPGSEELVFADCAQPQQKEEAVFKMAAGLAGTDGGWTSFESNSRPNWYVVAGDGGKLFVRKKADSEAFRKSATFWMLGPDVKRMTK